MFTTTILILTYSKAIYVVTSETLRIIYEHIQQNFSRREGSDGHFSMLKQFEAVLIQILHIGL